MTLLVLKFHRARADGPNGSSPEIIERVFAHVARHGHCVLPGQPLDTRRINVCLTFDDAYYDFHHTVLPLLKKHGVKALLGVPAGLCPERTDYTPAERLDLLDKFEMPYRPFASYCTWEELGELQRSGRVAFAAHGMEHHALDSADVDLRREVVEPKQVLQQRLGIAPESYVFPYGRTTRRVLRYVREHYRYALADGQATNRGWDAALLYRVPVSRFSDPIEIFTTARLREFRWRRIWNQFSPN